jgi:hypothetical protein
MATISGGDKLEAALRQMVEKVSNPATLRVGFLEGATYPDGKPVAMIAAIQEFGAPNAGIPPRPFFRNMIKNKSDQWPEGVKNALIATNYDAEKALDIVGAAIAGQLRQSVIDTNDPPLKPATIRRKGFAKPLIDTSVMINSIDHEVNK